MRIPFLAERMDASPFIFKNLTQVNRLRRARQSVAEVPAEKQIESTGFLWFRVDSYHQPSLAWALARWAQRDARSMHEYVCFKVYRARLVSVLGRALCPSTNNVRPIIKSVVIFSNRLGHFSAVGSFFMGGHEALPHTGNAIHAWICMLKYKISRKEPGRLIFRKWDRTMNQNN